MFRSNLVTIQMCVCLNALETLRFGEKKKTTYKCIGSVANEIILFCFQMPFLRGVGGGGEPIPLYRTTGDDRNRGLCETVKKKLETF